MFKNYRFKLITIYKKNKKWFKILESLKAKKEKLFKEKKKVELIKLFNI